MTTILRAWFATPFGVFTLIANAVAANGATGSSTSSLNVETEIRA